MFEAVNLPERRNVMGDWLIRGALGTVFIVFGWEKFPAGPGSEWIKIFQQIGLGQWFRYFTGLVEVLGGILLLVPWTATIGLALLACAMLGAMVTWLFIIGPPINAIFPGIFLAGLIAVYVSRRN